jgi:transcriptional regulator with XRE-family HTH domain
MKQEWDLLTLMSKKYREEILQGSFLFAHYNNFLITYLPKPNQSKERIYNKLCCVKYNNTCLKKMQELIEIGQRIEKVKAEFRFSNQQLGEICGVSYTAIANIIHGITKDPGVSLFVNLTTKLNISIEWLLFGKGEMLIMNQSQSKKDDPKIIKFLQQENENLKTIIQSRETEGTTLKKIIKLLEERIDETGAKKRKVS